MFPSKEALAENDRARAESGWRRVSELEAALRKVHVLISAASDETDPVEINGRLVEMAEAIRAVTNNRT